jgi:dTDP-4-dehydrorhamnose 3,5-epimerase
LNVIRTEIPEVLLLEPKIFKDERGALFESYNRRAIRDATGVDIDVAQENHSHSVRNVIRGLHYQRMRTQGKLVRAVQGEIFDVAVDIRRSSPTFGRWVGFNLSAANGRMAWIPPGFAHGLLALSETADVLYKLTDYWSPADQHVVVWNDSQVGVRWPIQGAPILSDKDARAPKLSQAELFP